MEVLSVETIVALKDNLVHFLVNRSLGTAAVIDPSDGPLVEEWLKAHGLRLVLILNTHHHWDHVGGNEYLARLFGAEVWVSERDRRRIPAATRALASGDVTPLPEGLVGKDGYEDLRSTAIPGHTEGQMALSWSEHLFVGDTLFAFGCGRCLEGRPSELFESLRWIKGAPGETVLHFGHEYTAVNLDFWIQSGSALLTTAKWWPHPLEQFRTWRSEAEVLLQSRRFLEAPTVRIASAQNPILVAPDVASFCELRAARDRFG